MTVKRIVPDFEMQNPSEAAHFYETVLGMKRVMDHGWIITFASDIPTTPQISIASEGGNGTVVPDASIEVEDVHAVYAKAKSFGAEIVYDLCDEEWGVTRFFVREPAGKLLNILAHTQR